MISLKSLIPEIKIIPNITLKVGQIWESTFIVDENDEEELDDGFEIGDKRILDYLITKLDNDYVWFKYYEDNHFIDPFKWERDLFLETIRDIGFRLVNKKLDEIKIVPQLIIPKLGDKYEVFLGDNQWHQGIITRVPYDEWTGISLTYPNKGYGQGKTEMGFRDSEQFNELIREKRLRKIKDINEIKIVPQEQIIQPAIGRYICFTNQLDQFDGYYSTYRIFDDTHNSWISTNIKSHAMSPLLKGAIDQGIKDGKVKIFKDIDSLNKYKNNLKEIKIVPNVQQPKVGDQFYWVEFGPSKSSTIIDLYIDNDGDYMIKYKNNKGSIEVGELNSLNRYIKNKEIKLIQR